VEEHVSGTEEGLEGVIQIRRTAGGYQVLHIRAGLGDSVADEIVVDGTLQDVHRAIDLLHQEGSRQRAELQERIRRELGPPHTH
jgi:hypothetical protein